MKKLLPFILLSFFFVSCKKDNNSNGNFRPTYTKPDIASRVPSTLQQSSPLAYSQIMQMDAYLNLGSTFMQMTGKAPVTDVSNTQWTSGPYTVTYNYNLVGNRYVYNYSISLSGNNFYSIDGWENTDGSAGHWAYNLNMASVGLPTSSDYNIDFDWSVNSSNDLNFDMVFDMGSSNIVHYITNINHDMSGDYTYFVNNQITYQCNWLSNGHGQFTDYSTTPPTIETW